MPVPTTPTDFDLFTSFRYDPKLLTSQFNTQVNGIELPYLLFQYHYERLVAAANYFGWRTALDCLRAPGAQQRIRHMCDQAVMESVLTDKEKGLWLRLLISRTGVIRVEAGPARPLNRDPLFAATINPLTTPSTHLPHPIFSVYIDNVPTPASVFTSFKTTVRGHYDAARNRKGIKDRRELREVMMYNERGEVTECSLRNIAFWRPNNNGNEGASWVSPHVRSGGLPGTVRRYLIERGLMHEGVIRVSDVRVGEIVLLSNGLDGTVLGRIVAE